MDFIFDDDNFEESALLWMQSKITSCRDDDNLRCGGSRHGRAQNIDRRHALYAKLLDDDFWGVSPVYNLQSFKKFFRLPRPLFDEIQYLTKLL